MSIAGCEIVRGGGAVRARALAAGATEDEIADVLLTIAPVAGLGRLTGAVPGVAAALGYDLETALFDP
jgi:alkylhydroperoxidase/carboxymuconolactone decarboxylase family protein YurZ